LRSTTQGAKGSIRSPDLLVDGTHQATTTGGARSQFDRTTKSSVQFRARGFRDLSKLAKSAIDLDHNALRTFALQNTLI
jgi:hypothetical protein